MNLVKVQYECHLWNILNDLSNDINNLIINNNNQCLCKDPRDCVIDSMSSWVSYEQLIYLITFLFTTTFII